MLSNEEVLKRDNMKRVLLETIQNRKEKVDLLIRHDSFIRNIMQEKTEESLFLFCYWKEGEGISNMNQK